MYQDVSANIPGNIVIELNGQTRFILAVQDLLTAPVDVIVSPANRGLAPGGGLAERILSDAGIELEQACEEIIQTRGMLEVTDAVMTPPGRLLNEAVIHAVGPRMGSGEEVTQILQTLFNAVGLVDKHNLLHGSDRPLRSIAFPAISTGIFCVPRELCAQAFAALIHDYQESQREICGLQEIWLCVGLDDFPVFKRVLVVKQETDEQAKLAPPVGQIELDEEDLQDLENDSVNDWFK